MRIYIPTRGRRHRQILFDALPTNLRRCVVFVCNAVEDIPARAPEACDVVMTPPWVRNIGGKRHFIMTEVHDISTHGPEVIMADDDLRLNVRRFDDPTKFRPMLPEDYTALFLKMYFELGDYAHVTVASREGGNRLLDGDLTSGRAMRLLGYDAQTFRGEGVAFNRVSLKEDFDVTLQLLRLGYPNRIITDYVQDDGGGSNAAGGCSLYRDEEAMVKSAEELHRLHPEFVKIVEKTTKGAWGGGTRVDVQIQWKKALESSNARR